MRPESEAEYLARLVPPSVAATPFGRRSLIKAALGLSVAATMPGVLAACGGGGTPEGATSAASSAAVGGTVTWGTNESGTTFAKQFQAEAADFMKRNSGTEVKINTVDHNTFQENINSYLQGRPDDVFTWFAGYRMRFFAEQGLAATSATSGRSSAAISDAFKKASTGDDGKQYFVPRHYYPWAVFYRKSVWQEKGYEVPEDPGRASPRSAEKMKTDGLVPIAFADKDGWPAMGTFDILNMRINGYDFHIDLMAGKEAWTAPRSRRSSTPGAGCCRYHQPGALGRTWQEAAQSLAAEEDAACTCSASFVAQQFPESDQDDLDFFTFPEIDPAIGAGRRGRADRRLHDVGASRRTRTAPRQLLKYLGLPRRSQDVGDQARPGHARRQLQGRRERLHRAAEEVAPSWSSQAEEHRPVPRPRHPAGLRLHRDDPGAPAVHQEPERHRRPHQEHREAEEDDLHRLTAAEERGHACPTSP